MKLESAHVDNFGVLHDFDITFESGINVLYEENGFGKSTLAAFIRVMFYGFDGDRRRGGTGEREKFCPWQGGTFGGTLSFTADDKPYRIERRFGRRRGDDSFRLYRSDTGLASSDFGKNPGEALFGLDCESFERTIYIAQGSLHNENDAATPAMQAQIGNLTQEAADMGSYDDAMKSIERAAASISPDRPSGRIRKLESERSSLEADASRLEGISRAARKEDAALRELEQEIRQVESRKKELTHRLTKNSHSLEVSALCKQKDLLAERERQAGEALSRCRSYFPGKIPDLSGTDRMIRLAGQIRLMQNSRPSAVSKPSRKKPDVRFPAVLSALFLILTAILFLTDHRALSAGPAVIFLVVIAVWAFRGFKNRRTSADSPRNDLRSACLTVDRYLEDLQYRPFFGKNLQRDTEVLTDSLLQIRDKCRELQMLRKAYSAARQERQGFEESHDFSSVSEETVYTADPDVMEKELDVLSEKSHRLLTSADESRGRLEELRNQVQACREAADQAQALGKEVQKLRGSFRILNLTAQYLREARADFTAQYRTPLMDSFTRYYGLIAGIFPEDFEINADLDVESREQGTLRSSRTLSAGLRDLTALCRRMAIIDAMYRGRQPFVILDDPFVNFDDAKMEGALRFLEEIAQNRQVIYLTCQSARMP